MIALMRQEWKITAMFGVVFAIVMIEPEWTFDAIRYASAMIYALLLAVAS